MPYLPRADSVANEHPGDVCPRQGAVDISTSLIHRDSHIMTMTRHLPLLLALSVFISQAAQAESFTFAKVKCDSKESTLTIVRDDTEEPEKYVPEPGFETKAMDDRRNPPLYGLCGVLSASRPKWLLRRTLKTLISQALKKSLAPGGLNV